MSMLDLGPLDPLTTCSLLVLFLCMGLLTALCARRRRQQRKVAPVDTNAMHLVCPEPYTMSRSSFRRISASSTVEVPDSQPSSASRIIEITDSSMRDSRPDSELSPINSPVLPRYVNDSPAECDVPEPPPDQTTTSSPMPGASGLRQDNDLSPINSPALPPVLPMYDAPAEFGTPMPRQELSPLHVGRGARQWPSSGHTVDTRASPPAVMPRIHSIEPSNSEQPPRPQGGSQSRHEVPSLSSGYSSAETVVHVPPPPSSPNCDTQLSVDTRSSLHLRRDTEHWSLPFGRAQSQRLTSKCERYHPRSRHASDDLSSIAQMSLFPSRPKRDENKDKEFWAPRSSLTGISAKPFTLSTPNGNLASRRRIQSTESASSDSSGYYATSPHAMHRKSIDLPDRARLRLASGDDEDLTTDVSVMTMSSYDSPGRTLHSEDELPRVPAEQHTDGLPEGHVAHENSNSLQTSDVHPIARRRRKMSLGASNLAEMPLYEDQDSSGVSERPISRLHSSFHIHSHSLVDEEAIKQASRNAPVYAEPETSSNVPPSIAPHSLMHRLSAPNISILQHNGVQVPPSVVLDHEEEDDSMTANPLYGCAGDEVLDGVKANISPHHTHSPNSLDDRYDDSMTENPLYGDRSDVDNSQVLPSPKSEGVLSRSPEKQALGSGPQQLPDRRSSEQVQLHRNLSNTMLGEPGLRQIRSVSFLYSDVELISTSPRRASRKHSVASSHSLTSSQSVMSARLSDAGSGHSLLPVTTDVISSAASAREHVYEESGLEFGPLSHIYDMTA